MGLTKYKEKRNFKESPEPTGGKAESEGLRFVIQKHAASHLHYDFRLEMEGVLKSWAVPKGPSTDPKVKRLAMMVEDHPYDYRNFEGIIPSGYGAGTVIVWDEGFYEPAHTTSKDKKNLDKELRAQLHKGKITFILKGKKLKGEYALVKAHGRGENGWLLFKVKDKYASTDDITLKDKSVVSKKNLEQVEKTTTNFYGSKRVKESTTVGKKEKELNKRADVKKATAKNKKESETSKKKVTAKRAKERADTEAADIDGILKSAPKTKFPTKLTPMLATLVDAPFNEPGWLYEVKWDGYRTLAFCNKGKVELKSRNDKSFNDKFYPIAKALAVLNLEAVLDGEVVVVNDEGISDFGALQNWKTERDGDLMFYAFDILWHQGKNLMELPLIERRAILKSVLPQDDTIRVSNDFGDSGIEFFEAAKQTGLEGIIAKKANSLYSAGDRNTDWLKIKANKRQEMVIGGFTKNDDTSKIFSSLVVGVFDGKELVYTGKIGTGFNDKTQRNMMKQFKQLIIQKSPFTEMPDVNKPSRFRPNPPHASVNWLKPELVCEVTFTEMTSDGIMRHPSFQGMRIDKKAMDVIRETATKTDKAVAEAEKKTSTKKLKGSPKADTKTLLNDRDATQLRAINGNELKFTNLNKLYWPKEKITKRDLINYYHEAAPFILPYLKDRPQSMLRHPDGITGFSFFYKNIKGKGPDWIETFDYTNDKGEEKEYLVAKDEASLLYMASLGCIEMNPFHSRVQSIDRPDWCIIDLDPAKNSFDKVIEAALVTKDVLAEMGVTGYPKTSGSTGIHIYIPFGGKYDYEQSKEFARIVVTLVHERLPKFTSIERAVKDRGGKMYLDFLQNRSQATVSAPYSVRPKPGATVSMPLHWDELKKGLKMTDFTIQNAIDRMKSEGDIFKPVLGKGIDLAKVVKAFDK
jgi:bifunctional non-homologous end joining protein LigD